MVVRLALLIAAAAPLLWAAVPATAPPGCGQCHPSHYPAEGACTACHRGEPRAARPELAHRGLVAGRFAGFARPGNVVVEEGKALIQAAGCRRCHVIGGAGNRLAADLDRLLPTMAPEEAAEALRHPAALMPDFALAEEGITRIVSGLLSLSTRVAMPTSVQPAVVYFDGERGTESVFDKRCGGCHRLLTTKVGGMGRGAAGPNLSGLLTEFYPAEFRDQERWSVENLGKWLKNPREFRQQAQMPPVRLPEEELKDIIHSF